METKNKEKLSESEQITFLQILRERFEENMNRHIDMVWSKIQLKLEANNQKIWSLHEMEVTGGEPDVVFHDQLSDEYHFYDCAMESPKGRRSLCYDQIALESRKENKPINSAIRLANEMGIELLTELEYRNLQQIGNFDTKTSSWLKTPDEIRNLGGAIFGDFRYGTIFIYHNGAESYYGARGFRGLLRV